MNGIAAIYPYEFNAAGHYKLSVLSGTIAAGLAADSEICQFRWTSSTKYCRLTRVWCDGVAGSGTAFAAGFGRIYATVARSWTAAGTGGGTATITGDNNKVRTRNSTTALAELRTATTAALGAGTKTLDANACGSASFAVGTTASVTYVTRQPLIGWDINDIPIILGENEGIAIRAVVPATGTWQTGFTFEWTESTEI